MKSNVFLREVSWLPSSIKGFTQETIDGDYNICINSNLSEDQKEKTIKHELCHIQNEDFLKISRVSKIEEDTARQLRLP